MKLSRLTLVAPLALAALAAACSDSTSPSGGNGQVVVKLTDAPFSTDSVARVDIYVVRVDGRIAAADSAAADSAADSATGGWQVLASPNQSFNLLAFQNGATTTLGQTAIAANTYNGLRFVIDPTKSSVTLKNGTVLTGSSNPGVKFPSANRSGLKVLLQQPLKVVGGKTTTLIVDFDVNNSFVMRGNSISQNGLLFKPVIRGTVIDAATVDASVRMANATNDTLNLLASGSALAGSSSLAFGASSACNLVNAATPALSVTKLGSSTALAGFPTTALIAGQSYTYVAYPTATGTAFTSLNTSTFVPTTGSSGLQVYNASGLATGLDVYSTASGAVLGTTPTIANTLNAASSSFVSVPSGTQQLRITSAGGSTVLLDLGNQSFTAGQNYTLIIAPPAAGSTAPRAFLVTGC